MSVCTISILLCTEDASRNNRGNKRHAELEIVSVLIDQIITRKLPKKKKKPLSLGMNLGRSQYTR